jgi:PemK-like, MazF-like toxin of type II toxin-antitoxin system
VTAAPRRGEIWLADLDKARPVIVLTRDPMGRLLNAVIVAPVTSTVRGISTEVPVGSEDGVRQPLSPTSTTSSWWPASASADGLGGRDPQPWRPCVRPCR